MKKTIITAAIIAVMGTSITAFAANNLANDSIPASPAVSTISAQQAQNSANGTSIQQKEDKTVNKKAEDKGPIEYYKMTYVLNDEKHTTQVQESWLNTNTYEFREDYLVSGRTAGKKETAGKVPNVQTVYYTSAYTLDGGKHNVGIQRDQSRKAIGGNEYYDTQEAADQHIKDIQTNRSFAALAASYADRSVWKDEGTEKDADGNTLQKISSGTLQDEEMHMLYLNDEGLPVKSEVFVNGKLFGVATSEYKRIEDDGKIFDISGVELRELKIIDDKAAK